MGPNLYAHRPCVKWKIDIGELEELPSNLLPGFTDQLKAILPSLVEHRCSEGERGGFFVRLDLGTWMGHVMEHIALELQTLVGSKVGFGRTRSSDDGAGIYNVVYEIEERETGIHAGEIALDLIEALVQQQPFAIEERLASLLRTNDRHALGPSTKSIVDAAIRRGIPAMRLDEWNLVQLGYGANARKIQATIASTTRHLGVQIAGDKDLTKSILGFHGIPVPKGKITRNFEDAVEIAESIGWPLVVKPLDASQGRGIVTNINSMVELRIGFDEAKKFRGTILIEQFLKGRDYRLLVVDHKFVAASERIPAHVIGDGKRTVRELVALENQDPRRGESHEKVLTKIKLDAVSEQLLSLRGLFLDSVLDEGQTVFLKTTANLSTGGTAVDVTDRVHPSNIEMAERIARLVDLDIVGVDIVSEVIDRPIEDVRGGIVEVNAAPGFRMHLAPTSGKSRPVGEAVVDMLFPPGHESRIPIITVTGTNGKTTTARLCAHIALQAGKSVGLTTSDGIYIRSRRVQKGDTTGPTSAAVVLRDPSVNFAVLETARGGLLRAGIGYDWSNAAIVTNIAEDHLGMRDINSLEDLAEVKAITVQRVFPEGYAILNAEDPMTRQILRHVECRLAMFAVHPSNERFRRHVDRDGLGATVEDGEIVLYDRGLRVPLCQAAKVPISFEGKAEFNVANALAAIIATYVNGVAISAIVSGLMTFYPSAAQTPGRLNVVHVNQFDVMIDYAHNPNAMRALATFIKVSKKGRAIAVFGLPGDRRDQDLQATVRAAATGFDVFFIREDRNLRGRQRGEVPALLRKTLLDGGLSEDEVIAMPNQREAVEAAFKMAQRDDIIIYIADKVDDAAVIVEELRAKYIAEAEAAKEAGLHHA